MAMRRMLIPKQRGVSCTKPSIKKGGTAFRQRQQMGSKANRNTKHGVTISGTIMESFR